MSMFTDKFISNLKPRSKQYQKGEGNGFSILVLPSGTRTFIYRYKFQSKGKMITIGSYGNTPPLLTLAEARKKFNELHAMFIDGLDPQAELAPKFVEPPAKLPDESSDELTIKKLMEKFITEWSEVNHSKAWSYENRRSMTADLLPEWGEKKVSELKPRDAIKIIEQVSKRAPGQARNVLKAARKMYAYAVKRQYAEINPFMNIDTDDIPAITPKRRERILSDKEITLVWSQIDEMPGTSEVKRAIKMVFVTAQRPIEVVGMHRREIDGNWWTIPWNRIKTEKGKKLTRVQRDHRVYLGPLAMSLLGDSDGYIFSSIKIDDHIVRNSMAQRISKVRPAYFGLPRWTPHDLRRTAKTLMARIGVRKEHSERVLNHTQDEMESTYNLYQYDKEKRAALLKLDKEITRLIKK
ncbi:MAG: site-specific integrase [Deltaproteobacteria bacterium]